MSKKLKPSDAQWTDIYTQLQEDKVEFFLNTQLEPTVLIPNDGFQKEWPVDSMRFQDLLVSVFYEISKGEILKSNERDFLMAQIREECRKGGRRLTEPETAETDEDVIVQAILALVNREPEFSNQTVILLKSLRKIQKEGCLSSSEEIPIFTNIFSRKLGRLIPVLRGYGIEVVMEHKESGSHCSLKRLESFQKEPKLEDAVADGSTFASSGQSSGVTSTAGMALPPPDDADGEFRADPPRSINGASDLKTIAATKKGGAK
jgi:hypothetical protein